MQEIDLTMLLNYFKSKIVYILFLMSITFCVSAVYVNRFRVPVFTTSTTVLLTQTNESTISSSDISLNNSLISTYSEIIKSKKVLRQVIDIMELDYEYDDLVSNVDVSASSGTNIIRISVTDINPTNSANIANTIATVFIDEIINYYKLDNINVVDAADVPTSPSSTSVIKIVLLATIFGFILGCVIVFIAFYFDTTLKNEEDIERITGLPVIGVIPLSREKIKGSQHRKKYEKSMKKHKSLEILPIQKEIKQVDLTKNFVSDSEIGIKK